MTPIPTKVWKMVASTSTRWRHSRSISSLVAVAIFAFTFFSSISPGAAIKCWECNSKNDYRCGSNFDNFTIALVDCNQRTATVEHIDSDMMIKYNEYSVEEAATMDLTQAQVCRKTTQIVDGETRVIRGCGWIRNTGYTKDRKCYMRTGTHQVLVYHCACGSDGCNPATRPGSSFLSMLTMLLLPLVPALAGRL